MVHRAYTVKSPVTGVLSVNSVPLPTMPVYHPANVQPVFVGAVGKVPTVSPFKTILLEGTG
jgi:hypothetical protein